MNAAYLSRQFQSEEMTADGYKKSIGRCLFREGRGDDGRTVTLDRQRMVAGTKSQVTMQIRESDE
jgi:hypothetical protein